MSGSLPSRDAASLVGRERERALLRGQLDAAIAGQGSLVLIGGEAGIGKTALAEAVCHAAHRRQAHVLIGHCYDLTDGPPYGPWIELLGRYRPDADASMPPAPLSGDAAAETESRAALFRQVLDFFAALATARPLVLLLDDLHWADDASVELLRVVARALPELPILLVGTYRSDELTRRHPLRRALPALAREGPATRVEVRPLDEDDLRGLVRLRYDLPPADEARLVAYLGARAEGNPFYAGELLRTLEEARTLHREPSGGGNAGWALGDLAGARIPPLLRQVIEERVDRLGEDAREVLTAAAIIGQEAPLDLWAAVAERTTDALLPTLERALEAHVLIETDGGVRLAHALIREALDEGALGPRRRTLHRRAAEALLRQTPQPDVDAVAHHLERAGDPRAAGWLVAAGERARARHAQRAAIERFTRALDMPAGLDAAMILRARRARGAAHETVGDFAAARRDYEACLDLARAAADRDAEWQALLDLGMLWAARDYGRTEEYYQRALDLARAARDPAMVARSLNRFGNWLMNMDRPHEARRRHEEALALFERLGDRRGIGETLDFLAGAILFCGDMHGAARALERAIAIFRECDDRHRLASALAAYAGRGSSGAGVVPNAATPAEGLRDAEEARQIAREIGWRAGEALATIEIAMGFVEQGEFGRGLAANREASAIAEAIDHPQWLVMCNLVSADVYRRMLNYPLARDASERALAWARRCRSVWWERNAATLLAQVSIAEGRLAEADALLETVTGAAVELSSRSLIRAWFVRAELAAARGDAAGVLHIADRLIADVPHITPERVPICVATLRGEALGALGRVDEAEAGLRAAIRDATQQGTPTFTWRAHLALAALCRRQSRHCAAARELAAARDWIDRLAGTIPDAQLRGVFLHEAAACLSLIPPAPPETPPEPAFGLSPREIAVLRLIADGHADREIADTLSISHRTVMTHVANILAKLGVSSRTAAASHAIRHGLVG